MVRKVKSFRLQLLQLNIVDNISGGGYSKEGVN
jgi:hypothetical protein